MPNPLDFEYQCSRCGKHTPREQLTVKKAVFVTPGEGGKTLRSRVTDHLCPTCIIADPDWCRPPKQKIEFVPVVAGAM